MAEKFIYRCRRQNKEYTDDDVRNHAKTLLNQILYYHGRTLEEYGIMNPPDVFRLMDFQDDTFVSYYQSRKMYLNIQ